MIRFASLGSGSKGNALLIQSGKTRVLLDCGFGPRALSARLARLGVVMDQIDAVVVTHEHSDHCAGLGGLVRRTGCPVFLSAGTNAAIASRHTLPGAFLHVTAGQPFEIGDLSITPFAVPHDAREPLQFVFSDGAVKLGVLTDAGSITAEMEAALSRCEGIVLEFNHDSAMLAAGPYPAFLKKRISGPEGHLDNQTAAALLSHVMHARLQHVLGAHLSEKNNTPGHVASHLSSVLSIALEDVCLASQHAGYDWLSIGGRL